MNWNKVELTRPVLMLGPCFIKQMKQINTPAFLTSKGKVTDPDSMGYIDKRVFNIFFLIE